MSSAAVHEMRRGGQRADGPSSWRCTPAGSVVWAKGLGKRIDERVVLAGIDLEVGAGEFVAVLGANGAGKTTLLKLLATLTKATGGELHLFGEDARGQAARLRRWIGMIGHQGMLYGDLSARENLVFFGRLYGVRDVARRAGELLERVGLAGRADDAVQTFSRGMVQRAAIARALMHDPQLLLADEPFAGLDVAATGALENLLAELNGEGRTVILVNHDVGQSLRLAQRVVVLRGGRKVLDEATAQVSHERVLAEVTA